MCVADHLMELADKVKAAMVCHRVHHDHGVSPLDGTGHVVSAAKAIGVYLKERGEQVSRLILG